jgi:hypothetical protein
LPVGKHGNKPCEVCLNSSVRVGGSTVAVTMPTGKALMICVGRKTHEESWRGPHSRLGPAVTVHMPERCGSTWSDGEKTCEASGPWAGNAWFLTSARGRLLNMAPVYSSRRMVSTPIVSEGGT